jgi:hypothetical protein
MPPTYAVSPKTGIPKTRVNPTHDRRTAIQLFFGVSLAQANQRGFSLSRSDVKGMVELQISLFAGRAICC